MREGCADYEEQHANRAGGDNAQIAMTTKTDTERNDAERYHGDKHLGMQVSLRELGEKRQAGHNEWQGETMHEAKRRQGDNARGKAPTGRLRRRRANRSIFVYLDS